MARAEARPGTAALTWTVRDGDYRVVVMNADADPGVDVDGTFGVVIPRAFALSMAVLVDLLASACWASSCSSSGCCSAPAPPRRPRRAGRPQGRPPRRRPDAGPRPRRPADPAVPADPRPPGGSRSRTPRRPGPDPVPKPSAGPDPPPHPRKGSTMSILPVPRSRRTDGEAPAARACSLTKVYGEGETSVLALDAVDVNIERERFTAVMGPSGSGKSTFMHCLAGLDSATSGEVLDRRRRPHAAQGRRPDAAPRGTGSGSSSRRTTWCPRSPRSRTSPCRSTSPGRSRSSPGWTRSSTPSGCADRLATSRASSPAVSNSASPARGRSSASRELVFGDEPTGNLDSRAGAEVLGFLRAQRRLLRADDRHGHARPEGGLLRRSRDLPGRRPGGGRHAGPDSGSGAGADGSLRGRRTEDLRCSGSASDPCWRTSCAWRCPWPRSCSASPSSRGPSSSPTRCRRLWTTSSPPGRPTCP